MYTRLSQQTAEFINHGSQHANDPNYRKALDQYSQEISLAIEQVCFELKSNNILSENWTSETIEPSDEDPLSCNCIIINNLNGDFLSLSVGSHKRCTWTYHTASDKKTINGLPITKTNAFSKYFEIEEREYSSTVTATFSTRQLISRYLVDYLIHLTSQLHDLIKVRAKYNRCIAA